MGKEKNSSGIPDSEKDAAIYVLTTAFEFHDKKKTLFKALDDFSDVYGDDIPGWLQYLYDHLNKSANNEKKLDVIMDFAEQRKIKLNI